MILVDTSVWVGHLHLRNADLAALLVGEQVLCHPFVSPTLQNHPR